MTSSQPFRASQVHGLAGDLPQRQLGHSWGVREFKSVDTTCSLPVGPSAKKTSQMCVPSLDRMIVKLCLTKALRKRDTEIFQQLHVSQGKEIQAASSLTKKTCLQEELLHQPSLDPKSQEGNVQNLYPGLTASFYTGKYTA